LAGVLGCTALGCATSTPEPEASQQESPQQASPQPGSRQPGSRQPGSRQPGSPRPPTTPAGGLIAFVSDREGVDALYLMRADGPEVRRLTGELPPVSHPAWSANGRRLAFNAGSPGASDI
jgi:hypothetical protein